MANHCTGQPILTDVHAGGNKKEPPVLGIILPCFNEELIITPAAERLSQLLDELINAHKISRDSFLFFVDDASRDQTWDLIQALHISNSRRYKGLRLLSNSGHQKALLAGLLANQKRVDCALTIDVDLQDDLAVIPSMIEHYKEGSHIVYGVKKNRANGDSSLKNVPAIAFYKLMRSIGVNLIYNHADFRLVSRQAIELLAQYPEVNVFLRGLFPSMGFKSSEVYYDIGKRIGGTSKYSWKRMLTLAVDGITSFTIVPIRFITLCGFVIFLFSSAMGAWAVVNYFLGRVVPGWASIIVAIYFMGGVQLIFLGVIGEYMSKIYIEVKRRPKFVKEIELF